MQSASTKLGPYVNDRIENRVVHSSVPINLAFYHGQTFFILRQSSNLTLNIHRYDKMLTMYVKIDKWHNYFTYSIIIILGIKITNFDQAKIILLIFP